MLVPHTPLDYSLSPTHRPYRRTTHNNEIINNLKLNPTLIILSPRLILSRVKIHQDPVPGAGVCFMGYDDHSFESRRFYRQICSRSFVAVTVLDSFFLFSIHNTYHINKNQLCYVRFFLNL